jgi:hypothetical protein
MMFGDRLYATFTGTRSDIRPLIAYSYLVFVAVGVFFVGVLTNSPFVSITCFPHSFTAFNVKAEQDALLRHQTVVF